MKQSQKNIQIVKVQVGDLRKKRKAKKKTKRSKTIVGTGQAPVLGQTQFSYPTAPMASRPGYQFEPPKQEVVDSKKDNSLKDAETALDQLKLLQERMKAKREPPSPFNEPSPDIRSPYAPGGYWNEIWRGIDTPPQPLERPQQPLVSAQASSLELDAQRTRAKLRAATFDQLNQLREKLNIGIPPSGFSKEQLIEVLMGYRPNR